MKHLGVRLGVLVVPADPWPQAVATAQRLERLGYDQLWTYDHFSWQRFHDQPWHSTYPWLTGIAAATTSIELGTMVSNPNIRHPLALAKDAMTIDHVSNGRLTIGLGAGGTGYDATVLGQEPLSPRQRMDRLVEYTGLFDGLLRGTVADHSGAYYALDDARMLPGCFQRPRLPIAMAANGPRGLELTARLGDAWITNIAADDGNDEATETMLRRLADRLDQACEQHHRDPATVERIYLISRNDPHPLEHIDRFEDFVGRYVELGFDQIVFHHPRPGDEAWGQPVEMVDAIADRFGRAGG